MSARTPRAAVAACTAMTGLLATAATLALAGTLLIVPSAMAAKVFPNCKAVNKVYKHGIAKNFKVIKTANGLTGRPFVGAKLYAAQNAKGSHHLDRDKDGVACGHEQPRRQRRFTPPHTACACGRGTRGSHVSLSGGVCARGHLLAVLESGSGAACAQHARRR
jgi:Excalibur calcium-binding domain